MSTQTYTNELNPIVTSNISEINKTYEKLKKCLYPDLFDNQNYANGNKIKFILFLMC